MTEEKIPLSIWVGCLAAYNAGTLHGDWIELDPGITEEDIQEEIDDILKNSPIPLAEEWAIMDYELPGGIDIGESEPLENIVAIVDGYHEHGNKFCLVWNHLDGDIDAVLEEVENCVVYDDIYDLCVQYIGEEEYDKLPNLVKTHLNWEGLLREVEIEAQFVHRDHNDSYTVLWN